MTTTDYIGAIMAVVIFLSLAAAYYYAFAPKNKKMLNKMRNFVNEE